MLIRHGATLGMRKGNSDKKSVSPKMRKEKKFKMKNVLTKTNEEDICDFVELDTDH